MNDAKRTGDRAKTGLGGVEFAGIGFEFALGILVFAAIGGWLDRRLGTTPWLLIVGVFVGAGGSFYSIYRKVAAAQRRDAEARRARRTNGAS